MASAAGKYGGSLVGHATIGLKVYPGFSKLGGISVDQDEILAKKELLNFILSQFNYSYHLQ